MRLGAVLVEDNDLAVFNVAHILRAYDVERAGFRRENRAPVELADHEGPNSQGIACSHQFLVGQTHEGIGTFQLAKAFDEAIDKAVASGARDKMQDHFGICGGLHHGAIVHQVAAQLDAIGEIAVVADSETAGIELGEKRLHIADDRFAGRRITDVSNCGCPGQTIDHFPPGEGVADETEATFGVEPFSIEGNNPGSFLAAVLKRVQAERGDRRGVGMAENSEDPAFLAETVRIGRDYANAGDYDTRFVGLNARMSELHAAVALESLADLDANHAARSAIADRYRAQLEQVPGVRLQRVPEGDVPTWKDVTIAIDPAVYGVTRDVLVTALRAEGIDTRRYFDPPVHRQQSHAASASRPLPVTDRVSSEVVSLPVYPSLRDRDVDRIATVVADVHTQRDLLLDAVPAHVP